MPKNWGIDSEISDFELAKAISAQDLDVLGLIYDRYSTLVYTIALKILRQPQEAEDFFGHTGAALEHINSHKNFSFRVFLKSLLVFMQMTTKKMKL